MTLFNSKKRHSEATRSLIVGVCIAAALTLIFLSLFVRSGKKAQEAGIVSPQEAAQQVTAFYDSQVREKQLEIQSSNLSSEQLLADVEDFLLTIRVPAQKRGVHISAAIRVRGLTPDQAKPAVLIAILETLL